MARAGSAGADKKYKIPKRVYKKRVDKKRLDNDLKRATYFSLLKHFICSVLLTLTAAFSAIVCASDLDTATPSLISAAVKTGVPAENKTALPATPAGAQETSTPPFQQPTPSQRRVLQNLQRASAADVYKQALQFLDAACQELANTSADKSALEGLQLPAMWLDTAFSDLNQPVLDQSVARFQAIERRGRSIGSQWSWHSSLFDLVELRITNARSGNRFVMLTLGGEYPLLELRTSNSCHQITARRIAYSWQSSADKGGAAGIVAERVWLLDGNGNDTSEFEWLNPEIPAVSESPSLVPVPVPSPSLESRQTRVAIIDSGVNYLLPQVARQLLRNEAGKLAGYDYWDEDDRPFDSHPVASAFYPQRHGTRTASLLIREAPFARVAVFRYPRFQMQRMQDVLTHIESLGIVLVGMPLGGNKRQDWLPFEQAALANPQMLFVVSAGNNGRDIDQQAVYPAALLLENMIVVSSADDSTLPAEGSNWGRGNVDYLLPAEHVEVVDFDGSSARVSGSSYAVSRMLAMLAQWQAAHPHWQAADFKAELRRRFNDGARSRYVSGGYIGDPVSAGSNVELLSESEDAEVTVVTNASSSQVMPDHVVSDEDGPPLSSSLQATLMRPEIVVLDNNWSDTRIEAALTRLSTVLAQCNIRLAKARIRRFEAAEHLLTMSVGGARTLKQLIRPRYPAIYLVSQTRMLFERNGSSFRFDAEAFGRGNTRGRDWLRDTVWISHDSEHTDLAISHELMHVLMNSGEHVDVDGNLMNARTSVDNIRLNRQQCQLAIDNGLSHGLLQLR